jgi:hypothetical protein
MQDNAAVLRILDNFVAVPSKTAAHLSPVA